MYISIVFYEELSFQDIHVLDAGCGTGLYTKALIELGVGNFSLLDASPAMLGVAKEKLKSEIENKVILDVIEAKLPVLPFKDGLFDAVMFNMVTNHLVKAKEDHKILTETLIETKRILRRQGVMVISTIQPSIYKSIWYTQIFPALAERQMKTALSTGEFLTIFEKCGFKCVAGLNLLSKATPTLVKNYFDFEGPFQREWLIGAHMYALAEKEEKVTMEELLLDWKRKGLLKKFMDDHDRTSELGFLTVFVCVST